MSVIGPRLKRNDPLFSTRCQMTRLPTDATLRRTDDPRGPQPDPPLVSRAMTDAPENDPMMPKMKQYAPIASLPTSRLTQYPDPRPTAMANTINNRSPASCS